jgi:hypothetical protein
MSYTLGPVLFKQDQLSLVLRYAGPPKGAGASVVGVDKRTDGSYRLDGIILAEGLTVDLSKAIHPNRVRPEDLGFLASMQDGARTVLLPVIAGAPEEQHKTASLVWRAATAVIAASAQVCELDGVTCTNRQRIAENAPAGSLLTLSIPRRADRRVVNVSVNVILPGNLKAAEVVAVMTP